MSLVTRTVTKNILPSSHTLMSQVGAVHANNPTAPLLPELDEAKLAEILRQPLEEVSRRRHLPRTDTGYVDFFGCAIRSDEIVFRRRRFGATAVGHSAHARALWSLKIVPCCNEHWEYLIDSCACGKVQRWQAADRIDRCDNCNSSLADAPTLTVEPQLRPGLAFLIGIIDPDKDRRSAARALLPDALSTWDGGMIFELALTVMPLTKSGFAILRGTEPKPADLPRYAEALAQAADIVRCWPEGFTGALIDAVHKRSTSRCNVRYKGMGHYVSGIESDLLPTIVRAELDTVLNPVKSLRDGIPDDQIGMRDAALLIGQSEHKLATGRRNGQLALRICRRANRIIPTLDRAEIEELNDLLHNRLGPEKFTHSLHLPQYAMAQLSAEKLITCITHPYVVAHHGPLQAHALELEAFRDELLHEAASIDEIACPVPLHRAARAMGGGPKPWGEIFRDLLNRTIRYSIEGRLSVDRIMISAGDAAKLRSRDLTTASLNVRSRFVSQRDAAEILNLPIKHAHLLPVSRRRSGGAHEISWNRVRRLARNRITLAELSARSGIQGTTLKHVLEREGCPRHDELGWIRSKALAKIANY